MNNELISQYVHIGRVNLASGCEVFPGFVVFFLSDMAKTNEILCVSRAGFDLQEFLQVGNGSIIVAVTVAEQCAVVPGLIGVRLQGNQLVVGFSCGFFVAEFFRGDGQIEKSLAGLWI